MSSSPLLGRVVPLTILRFGPPGAFLVENASRPDPPTILLPGAEIPDGAQEGDLLSVFVYLDSEDRPIATTGRPRLLLGEVAFLEITARTRFGHFAGWGLGKELLVPFAEQVVEPKVGHSYAIGLYRDNSGRLAGTMRVSEMLALSRPAFRLDQWIDGEAWRNDETIGLFAILQKRSIGLVPASEPHQLSRGQPARFRVARILPDGKVELSLRGHVADEMTEDARRILSFLMRPGAPRVGDDSSPGEIRDLFSLSKKAFKRAVGRLLKEGAVSFDGRGMLVVTRTAGMRGD